jgi:hypothetical protein
MAYTYLPSTQYPHPTRTSFRVDRRQTIIHMISAPIPRLRIGDAFSRRVKGGHLNRSHCRNAKPEKFAQPGRILFFIRQNPPTSPRLSHHLAWRSKHNRDWERTAYGTIHTSSRRSLDLVTLLRRRKIWLAKAMPSATNPRHMLDAG